MDALTMRGLVKPKLVQGLAAGGLKKFISKMIRAKNLSISNGMSRGYDWTTSQLRCMRKLSQREHANEGTAKAS